jgi:hypothetical protein
MRRTLARASTFLIVMLVGTLALPGGWASAADAGSDKLALSESASEIVIGVAKNPRPTITMNVSVSGPVAATVEISLVDLYSSSAGDKMAIPVGSSPYSLQGAVVLSASSFKYTPSAQGTIFHLQVSPMNASLDSLKFGGVQFLLKQQPTTTGAALVSQSSIVTSLVLTPVGYSGGLPAGAAPKLEMGEVTLSSGCGNSWIWQLLPEIPGVIDCTPVAAAVQITNQGTLPGMVSTSWAFMSNNQELAKSVAPAHLLLPGQQADDTARSASRVTGRTSEVNAAPFIGVVEVTAVANFELAGENQGSASGSGSVLVLPWKFPAFLLMIAGVAAGIVIASVKLWRRRHPQQVTYRPFPWKV